MGAASAGVSSVAPNVSAVRPRLSVTRPAARAEGCDEPATLAVLERSDRRRPGYPGLAAGDGEQVETGRSDPFAQHERDHAVAEAPGRCWPVGSCHRASFVMKNSAASAVRISFPGPCCQGPRQPLLLSLGEEHRVAQKYASQPVRRVRLNL